MGPNAVPVPQLSEAVITDHLTVKTQLGFHYSKGDKTADSYVDIKIPIFRVIQISASIVPMEYFRSDTLTRDDRVMRIRDAKGFSGGDLYLGTEVKLLSEGDNRPALTFTFNLKTASGTYISAARFTNTPGYSMYISAGKNVSEGKLGTLRLFAQSGFYCYQLYDPIHAQDDAFHYGLGTSLTRKRFSVSTSLSGYVGYMKYGDRPMVWRADANLPVSKSLSLCLSAQQGLINFNYSTLRAGLTWRTHSPYRHIDNDED